MQFSVTWLVLLFKFFPSLCPRPPHLPCLPLQDIILAFGGAFLPTATLESGVHFK